MECIDFFLFLKRNLQKASKSHLWNTFKRRKPINWVLNEASSLSPRLESRGPFRFGWRGGGSVHLTTTASSQPPSMADNELAVSTTDGAPAWETVPTGLGAWGNSEEGRGRGLAHCGNSPVVSQRTAERPKQLVICNSDREQPVRESMVLYQSSHSKCHLHFDFWPPSPTLPTLGPLSCGGHPSLCSPFPCVKSHISQAKPTSRLAFQSSPSDCHLAVCSAGLSQTHKGIRSARQCPNTSRCLES